MCVARSWFVELVVATRICFVIVVVIARAVWGGDFAVRSGSHSCSKGVILSEVTDLCPLNA